MPNDKNMVFDSNYHSMIRKEYWDFRAKDYNRSSLENAVKRNYQLIKSFLDNGIISSESRILDLGCGSGVNSSLFSPFVKEVVGIDISENMIAYAKDNNRKNCNTIFIQGDWAQIDIKKLGKFDFVFANMSPAVYDSKTLNKMNEICTGYCYYSHFAAYTSNIGDALNDMLGITDKKERIKNIFSTLWDQGCHPTVSYQDMNSVRSMELSDAMEYFQIEYEIPDEYRKQEEIILRSQMKNGLVEVVVRAKKAQLFWNVKSFYE